jgi:hypothetical protein
MRKTSTFKVRGSAAATAGSTHKAATGRSRNSSIVPSDEQTLILELAMGLKMGTPMRSCLSLAERTKKLYDFDELAISRPAATVHSTRTVSPLDGSTSTGGISVGGVRMVIVDGKLVKQRDGEELSPFQMSTAEAEAEDRKYLAPNIKILAQAGAGKTRTLLLYAQACPDKRFVILTYNKNLQIDMEKTIEELGLKNVIVKTYHAAAGWAYKKIIKDDQDFIDALASGPAPAAGLDRLYGDVVCFDETQDMNIYYYFLAAQIIDHLSRSQVIVVGDERQAINAYLKARVGFLTRCNELPGFNSAIGRPWVQCTLSTSYRLTPATANFVAQHLGGGSSSPQAPLNAPPPDSETTTSSDSKTAIDLSKSAAGAGGLGGSAAPPSIVGGNVWSPNLKPIYLAPPSGSLMTQLGSTLREMIDRYGHQNIAIIAPSTKCISTPGSKHPLAILVREHLNNVPVYIAKDGQQTSPELMEGKLLVASWNSTKGQERECVFVLNFSEEYLEYYDKKWPKDSLELPNVVYVAATRARSQLVLVSDPDKTFRTVNLTRLKDDVQLMSKDNKRDKNGMQKEANIRKNGGQKVKEEKEAKVRELTVNELLKHSDATIVHQLIKLLKISSTYARMPTASSTEGASMTVKPKTMLKSIIQFTKNLRIAPTAVPDGTASSSTRKVISYSESVTSLYDLVVAAIVELKLTGKSMFAQNARKPTIVDSLEEATAQGYCLTRAAYYSFPPSFWSNVEKAYSVPADKRQLPDWFQLAVAENVFNENGHHTARQITNYDWIDQEFVDEAVECLYKVLSGQTGHRGRVSQSVNIVCMPTGLVDADAKDTYTRCERKGVEDEGTFYRSISQTVGNNRISGVIDFDELSSQAIRLNELTVKYGTAGGDFKVAMDLLKKQIPEGSPSWEFLFGRPKSAASDTISTDPVMWQFRCVEEETGDQILRNACLLALEKRKIGNLYLLLSGKIVRIQLDDPDEFLKVALSKYDKREVIDLLEEIELAKRKYLLKPLATHHDVPAEFDDDFNDDDDGGDSGYSLSAAYSPSIVQKSTEELVNSFVPKVDVTSSASMTRNPLPPALLALLAKSKK